MASIKIGLIGLGEWARQAYVPVLRELSDVEVVAVAVRSDATRQFAQQTFGNSVKLHNTYQDLLADDDISAVLISLPNSLHAQVNQASLAGDKHVFCEPPVGLNSQEIEYVSELMAQSSRVVQLDLELRYLPVMASVTQLIESGAIGEPLMAKVRLWCDWGYGGGNWNQNVQEEGFFLWLGCWYLDVLDVIFQAAPLRAAVVGGYAMNGRLMDHGWATLNYPDNRIGQLEFSLVAVEGLEITVTIAGTNGHIQADLQSGTCRYRQKNTPWQTSQHPSSLPAYGFAGMRESITDFFTAIRSGRPAKANPQVSRRIHHGALLCTHANR